MNTAVVLVGHDSALNTVSIGHDSALNTVSVGHDSTLNTEVSVGYDSAFKGYTKRGTTWAS